MASKQLPREPEGLRISWQKERWGYTPRWVVSEMCVGNRLAFNYLRVAAYTGGENSSVNSKARLPAGVAFEGLGLGAHSNLTWECAQMKAGSAERPVTYQITMCGHDGVVIASDRRELLRAQGASVPTINETSKIRISPEGNYAWAYSGGRISPIFARRILRAFEQTGGITSDQEAKDVLEKCSAPAIQEWREYQAAGPDGESIIVMASGATKSIFRCIAMPTPEAEKMESGLCITGQTGNWAAFLPNRYFRRQNSVDELACLAACSILMASQFDPLAVNGLDVAIYRDSESRFEIMDSGRYLEGAYSLAEQIDGAIVKFIRTQAAAASNSFNSQT